LPLDATIRATVTPVNPFPYIEQQLSPAIEANTIPIKK